MKQEFPRFAKGRSRWRVALIRSRVSARPVSVEGWNDELAETVCNRRAFKGGPSSFGCCVVVGFPDVGSCVDDDWLVCSV